MRSAISGSLVAANPPTTSEWPPRYFVAECTTMSAPQLERPLQERRGERVVDDDARAALVRDRAHAEDVDDRERGVGGRLDPDQRGAVGPVARQRVEVGEVGDRPLDARRREHLRHEAERAAVRVVGDDHALAGLEQPQHRVLGRHPARRTRTRGARPRATPGTPRTRGGWGCRCARTRSPSACPTSSCTKVDDSVMGVTTAPGRGVGWLAVVDGAGLEAVGHGVLTRVPDRPGTSTRRSG